MKRNILVIAPHADDEVLGCGGVIAKHAASGDTVHILICTNASKGAPELFSEAAIQDVRKEAKRAHALLGVTDTHFLDLPAPALDCYPSYKIALDIGRFVDELKPNIAYLPYPGDLHTDHEAIYRASLVAMRPLTKFYVSEILCYETLSETEWSPTNDHKTFSPNIFVNISDFFETKIAALQHFKSQMKTFPHPRSTEAITALAKFRGSTVNLHYAEAFTLERNIFS